MFVPNTCGPINIHRVKLSLLTTTYLADLEGLNPIENIGLHKCKYLSLDVSDAQLPCAAGYWSSRVVRSHHSLSLCSRGCPCWMYYLFNKIHCTV